MVCCLLACTPRAITTLQSNQLRGLVGASLEDYLSFFRRHPAVAQVDPQQDKLTWSVPPVFELELVLQPGVCVGESLFSKGTDTHVSFCFGIWAITDSQ